MSLAHAKAYAATLPKLRGEELARLETWARDSCWRSALAPERRHTIWVAIRERTRSKAMWTRHVLHVLAALSIDTRPLISEAGDWLHLCTIADATEKIQQMEGTNRSNVARQECDVQAKLIDLPSGRTSHGPRNARPPKTTFEIVRG